MPPSTAELRHFLADAFSEEELRILCFDYFRDVYDNFTTGMTKGQMTQFLIERCDRRDALPHLEAVLRKERPEQYVKRFEVVIPPTPSAVPATPVPMEAGADAPTEGSRDPRQVFISHAHQDAEFAHRLAGDLAIAGWRPWIAPDNILPGEKWVEAIDRGLGGSGVFLVVLTPAAVGSRRVVAETYAAIQLEFDGKALFIPLDVALCDAPFLWSTYQNISFRGHYEEGLRRLLGQLRSAATTTSGAIYRQAPMMPNKDVGNEDETKVKNQDKEREPETLKLNQMPQDEEQVYTEADAWLVLTKSISDWIRVVLRTPVLSRKTREAEFIWHKHWVQLLRQAGLPFGMLLLWLASGVLILIDDVGVGAIGISKSVLGLPWALFLLLLLFWIWWEYEDYHNDIYVIVEDKIIVIEANPLWLMIRRRGGELSQVQKVIVIQDGFWQKFLRYGNVDLILEASKERFTFSLVPNPQLVQYIISLKLDVLRARQSECQVRDQ